MDYTAPSLTPSPVLPSGQSGWGTTLGVIGKGMQQFGSTTPSPSPQPLPTPSLGGPQNYGSGGSQAIPIPQTDIVDAIMRILGGR